jgi:hypothetical protein
MASLNEALNCFLKKKIIIETFNNFVYNETFLKNITVCPLLAIV